LSIQRIRDNVADALCKSTVSYLLIYMGGSQMIVLNQQLVLYVKENNMST